MHACSISEEVSGLASHSHDTVGARIKGLDASTIVKEDVEAVDTGEAVAIDTIEISTSGTDIGTVAVHTELPGSAFDLEALSVPDEVAFRANLALVVIVVEDAVRVDELADTIDASLADGAVDVLRWLFKADIILKIVAGFADLAGGVSGEEVGAVGHVVFADISQ